MVFTDCDKKISVLFTDTGCFVLSPDFKLADERQVLLKVPRKNNLYSVDMKNIVPKESLTCLVTKATLDESMLWHRRLGHVKFKTINKLVKENLVRGLPTKHFENDQTCVACLKGKQHKASYGSLFDSSSKNASNDEPQPSSDAGKKDGEGVCKESGIVDQEKPKNSTQGVNTVGPSINAKPDMFSLGDNAILEATHADFFDDETELDMSNITTTYPMDVKSAFLYGKIEEEVYVCQPPGFEDPEFPDRVYKVEKALYGLHQAPRAWYETLSTYLLENGFQRGTIDKTLFIKKFEKLMHKKFQMSSMGELTFFLGLQVMQKEDGIFISQDKYVDEILKKFGFSTVRIARYNHDTSKPLLKDVEAEDVDVYLYRSMIGSLMYLTTSRPDIMFVVCACARFQVTPKVSHLHAMKRIFRYLKGQPKLGLWYPKDSPFDLEAYSDSDYAGEFKMQTIVANSTTKVERNSWKNQKIMLILQEIVHFLNASPYQMTTQAVEDEVLPEERGGQMWKGLPILLTRSLDAEQKAGIGLGGSPRFQEAMGDTIAQIRSVRVSIPSYDSPLPGVNTPRSDKERIKLKELMDMCTKLSDRSLDLENVKDAQALEIKKLKKRVKKLESKKKSRTAQLKRRLFKVRIESSAEKSLVVERLFTTLPSGSHLLLDGVSVTTTEPSTPPTTTIPIEDEDLTIAQTLMKMKSKKSKAKRVSMQEPSESGTRVRVPPPQIDPKDKGKAKMVEPEKPKKKKDQIEYDADVAQRLQAELDEEARLEREREEEASKAANIVEWDVVQAMMDADFKLATKLQEQEREELTIEERSKLFVELLNERKKHFARLRAEERRRKPPTKTQKRNLMSTYLKNMAGYKNTQLKNRSFEEIQMLFEKEMKRVNIFVDMDAELVKGSETIESKVDRAVPELAAGSSKRDAEEKLDQESSKRQKTAKSS
ncbi:putative ribonuclease H-like domain-containing protein [Tanacetum coccineum]